MKKLQNCIVENCIPTPASCVQWNGGDIEFLGICNGEWLTTVVWEIITKLQELAGEDLSSFDIDDMLDICNQKRPLEVNLVSILTLLKNNDICLKDYIDTLNDKINELSAQQGVNVNLKCYADFDNVGNALSITREQLDQLVIDKLCAHETRLNTLDGKIIGLQSQIDDIANDTTVEELDFPTCINGNTLPTSTQVINTSQALCDLRDATGLPIDIAAAIAKYPATWNAKFGPLLAGWLLNPDNQADVINNLILLIAKMDERLTLIENTCCAPACDKIKIGIQFIMNDDDTVDMVFSSGAGTYIPPGFEDCGTTITFTDKNGVEFSPSLATTPIEQDGTVSGVNVASLATGTIKVNVKTKFCLYDEFGTLITTCQDCFSTEFENTAGCCVLTNTSAESNTIIYRTTVIS